MKIIEVDADQIRFNLNELKKQLDNIWNSPLTIGAIFMRDALISSSEHITCIENLIKESIR